MKLTLNKTALVVAQALTVLGMAGCGGNDASSTDVLLDDSEMAQAERLRWRSMDKSAPSVSIDEQSGDVGGTAQITLSGQASDNLRLYRVRWSNDRGGSGRAALSGNYLLATWSASPGCQPLTIRRRLSGLRRISATTLASWSTPSRA